MRKLVWFAVGFFAACIPVGYFMWNYWFLLAMAAVLCVGVGLCFVKTRVAKKIAVACFGAALAFLWCFGFHMLYWRYATPYDGSTSELTLEAADYSAQSGYSTITEARLRLGNHTYPVRVYADGPYEVKTGDALKGTFYLRLTTGNGENAANYHRANGIVFLAIAQGTVAVSSVEKIPLRYMAKGIRRTILNWMDAVFPADVLGFARALLLGDSSLLSYEEETAFQISGIRHIIAVSGLHMSILFAMMYVICGKHRVLTAVFGMPVLFLFACVAGLTPSILRACVMQSVMLLAMLLKREYDPPSALSAAVLVILFRNPMTVTAVGFQLSVGCLVGIFLFAGRLNSWLLRLLNMRKRKGIAKPLCKWFSAGVAVTLSAMAATTPLCAIYFKNVSIVSILTNLATLWVVPMVFCGIIAAALLGAVWLPVGKGIGWLVAWPMRYVVAVAKLFSDIPQAAVYTESVYIVMWLVFSYLLFVVLLFSKKKRPFLASGCVLAGLILAVAMSWITPRLDNVRVTAIDVGQGQAILLESKGKHYLVDCGGDSAKSASDAVAGYLHSCGVFSLDGVFVTHYDVDHAGGLTYLYHRMDIKTLYLPDIPDDGSLKKQLENLYSDRVVHIRNMQKLEGSWGTLTMVPGENETDENESSMCILFQAGNCDILITGDRGATGEKQLLEQIDLPELELLVAGHHGAPNSTTVPLLSKTKPKAVMISLGKDNPYGHPDPGLLTRMEIYGCRVLRTDQEGTVIFRR